MTEPSEKKTSSEDDEVEASAAPLLDHLTELRSRLIVSIAAIGLAFVLCFVFSKQIFDFLIIPFVRAVGQGPDGRDPTLYFAPLEFFFTRVRLSVFAGVVVAFPVLAYEAYRFVAPGLYRRERKAALPFLVAMPALFLAGASLVYFVMMPFVMRFAVGFEAEAGEGQAASYQLLTRVGDYLALTTTLMLAFGFAFQLPVFLTLLARAGLIDAAFLTRHRKIAIVLIFVAAAFLTPPDPFSQLVLGSCILGLYEVSVLSVKLAEKKAKRERDDSAAQTT
ncbi:MAG: twin-arginine translocase subunit TatC [Amphiplicatus sp.]